MARQTKLVRITAKGRDNGKTFRIREMAALQAERWALRALHALAGSGVELPDNLGQMPMAQLAALGLKALSGVPFEVAEPLLDEMMACVSYVPNPQKPDAEIALNMADDIIEEVTTAMQLRKETFMVHIGFFTEEEPPTTASTPGVTFSAS